MKMQQQQEENEMHLFICKTKPLVLECVGVREIQRKDYKELGEEEVGWLVFRY